MVIKLPAPNIKRDCQTVDIERCVLSSENSTLNRDDTMFKRRRPFLITIASVIVAFTIYYPFSPGGIQARNMAKVRSHISVVQRAIGSDPRFANIQLFVHTAEQGSLFVRGTVKTGADLDRLKGIITATSPPTAVIFSVSVEDEISIDKIDPAR